MLGKLKAVSFTLFTIPPLYILYTTSFRENKHMLCKPLLETIFRGSLRFVAPNSSYCLLDYNYNWFNSSDYVAISQLEMARRFHTECPVIPGKGNCTCTPEHMISTVKCDDMLISVFRILFESTLQGDPAHPEAKIFCRVDCANMGLTELPSRLPENTFQLDITNNSVRLLFLFYIIDSNVHFLPCFIFNCS